MGIIELSLKASTGKEKIMRIQKGSSVSQYAIIIVLIALALVPVLYILGKNISENFNSFSQGLENKDTQQDGSTSISNSTLTVAGGELGGTPDKPVKVCDNSSCTVDYGDFVLQGIPADLNSFLQSSGTSGTTKLFAGMLDQITAQIEKEDNSEEVQALKDLANLQHYTAEIQKIVEEAAKKCDNQYSSFTSSNVSVFESSCFKSELSKANMPTIPANLKEIISYDTGPFSSGNMSEGFMQALTTLSDFGNLGEARYAKATDPASFATDKATKPTYTSIDVLDNILTGDQYSNSLKGVTASVLNNINILGAQLEARIAGVSGSTSLLTMYETPTNIKTIRDVVTGDEIASFDYSKSSIEDIIAAQSAIQTDYFAGIICESGYNKDNGYQCNK
jgi:Flp pilus assembly pilin Flp